MVSPGQVSTVTVSSYSGMRPISARWSVSIQSSPLSSVMARPMPSSSVWRMETSCMSSKSTGVRSLLWRFTSLLRRRSVMEYGFIASAGAS